MKCWTFIKRQGSEKEWQLEYNKKETEKEHSFSFVSLISEKKNIFQISYKTSIILIANSDQYSTKGFQI